MATIQKMAAKTHGAAGHYLIIFRPPCLIPERSLVNRKPSPTRLRIESLEYRQLLAGDIDAHAIGTVLYIDGDSTANGLAIQSPSEGVFEVTGLPQGGSATTINEHVSESFVHIKELFVNLDDGDDVLVLTNLSLQGSVTIHTGDGDDFIGLGEFNDNGLLDSAVENILDGLLGALTITTNLTIDTADDNDTLQARNVVVKLATILMGEGNDSITLDGNGELGDPNFVPGVTTGAALTIGMGNGENSVSLEKLNAQSLSLILGDDQDTVSLKKSTITKRTDINAQNGANSIELEEVTSKSLGISLGLGNDEVSLDKVTTTGRTVIGDSFGNDSVELNEVTAKSLGVSLGVGNDELSLTDVTVAKSIDLAAGEGNDVITLLRIIAKSLDVWLDGGDDELSLDNVAITKCASLSGGLGNDSMVLDGVSAQTLKVSLGVGDDDISLEHVLVGKTATIDGGIGDNVYTDLGGNTFAKLNRKNFQTII
jgi:hypothetical protein